jgi:hypothetical protein
MLPPLRGSMDTTTPQPLADARGYLLSPLRGWSAANIGRRTDSREAKPATGIFHSPNSREQNVTF